MKDALQRCCREAVCGSAGCFPLTGGRAPVVVSDAGDATALQVLFGTGRLAVELGGVGPRFSAASACFFFGAHATCSSSLTWKPTMTGAQRGARGMLTSTLSGPVLTVTVPS